jgi:ribosomal protein L37E
MKKSCKWNRCPKSPRGTSQLYYPSLHDRSIRQRSDFEGPELQPLGRCPRCGYALTYDGRSYRCEFCGYPRTRQTLMASLRNLERNIRFKMENLNDSGRRDQYQRMSFQFPYAAREQVCSACGLRIPNGVQVCPYCRTPFRIAQPSPETINNPIPQTGDQRVLDYIASHNGTISISQAATELSIPLESLRTTIERLKSAGLLNPT